MLNSNYYFELKSNLMGLDFKIMSIKQKRKFKKLSYKQEGYYCPIKAHHKGNEPHQNMYSLRNRSRGVSKNYIEYSEDEFDYEEEIKEVYHQEMFIKDTCLPENKKPK